MTAFISTGVENVIRSLACHSGEHGEAHYPKVRIAPELWKLHEDRDLQEWFITMVDHAGENFLDEKIALWAETKWTADQMKKICMQCVCMRSGTLTDYYCKDKEAVAHYFRLDYDMENALGALFKEPHPHLHTKSGSSLKRVGKNGSRCIFPI